MSYIFILYNEHGPHRVFYNVTKYQSSIFTLGECSGGVNETRVEWKCVPENLALGPLSGGVLRRLQLLFCVVHIDYQSILFFGHWYAYACILLMYLIIFKQKTALKQNIAYLLFILKLFHINCEDLLQIAWCTSFIRTLFYADWDISLT